MVKKIFVGIVIAAVFGALILGGVNQAWANNDFSSSADVDANVLGGNADDTPGIPEEKQNEYLYSNQNGECDGTCEDPLCNQEMVQEQHQYEYHNEYQYTNQQCPEGCNLGDGPGMQSGQTGNGEGVGHKGGK